MEEVLLIPFASRWGGGSRRGDSILKERDIISYGLKKISVVFRITLVIKTSIFAFGMEILVAQNTFLGQY